MPLTTWDIGGCGCGGCQPCPLPAANLQLTYVNPTFGTHVYTLLYSTAGGNQLWQLGCVTIPGVVNGMDFVIGCTPGCSFYAVASLSAACPNSAGQGSLNIHSIPSGCANAALINSFFGHQWSGTATFSGGLTAACTPLSLVLVNGAVSWTIAPMP